MVGAHIRNNPFGTELAFAKGLRQVGVDVIEIDPSYDNQKFDYDADATIVMKHVERADYKLEILRCQNGPRILFQPDDYRFSHIREMVKEMRTYCDFIMTFDEHGAIEAKRDHGYSLARKMLVCADPDIYQHVPYDDSMKDIDFCFVGSFTDGKNHVSRRQMCEVLTSAGLSVGVLTHCYDVRLLSEAYARSKVVLNHATDVGQAFGTGWGFQCRHFEAGLVGSCILSNKVLDRDVNDPHGFATFTDEWSLVHRARGLLTTPEMRKNFADGLYQNIIENHMPHHRALEMLKFISECRSVS